MKKSLYGIVLFTSIVLAACSQTRYIQDEPYVNDEPSNSITYQQFYDDLSPYGQWINNPEFGYVWAPHLSGFRPYSSNGYWTYTNYGWTWVSNYNWGWAPFHYGRWFYDDFEGWVWVPGYDWAPAWVNWRGNSQYYGWSPMYPTGRNGRYYEPRNDQWCFVPQQYINRRNINNYYVNQQNNSTIINNTTEIAKVRVINNNTKYQEGPSVTEVEKVTNTKIRPLPVKQSTVPGTKLQNGALRIYKPVVRQTAGENVKPSKVIGTRSLPPEASQPAIVTPQTNGNGVRSIPVDNTPKPAVVGKINNNRVPLNQDANNDDRVIVNPPVNNNNNRVTTVTPPANNTNEPSVQEPQKVRQFPAQQNQPVYTPRMNSTRVRPADNNDNIPKTPQQSRTNINVPDRRQVAPQQSPARVYERERANGQQQSPAINQRPVRERTAPVFNSPSNTFERKPQTVPNSSSQVPVRLNRNDKR
jgi:hypothetical protein